jgi:hypothetical protein
MLAGLSHLPRIEGSEPTEEVPVQNRNASTRRRRIALATAVLCLPLLLAFHWASNGWRDHHYNYPARPNGYTQIVNRFGQPCSEAARKISMDWIAADTGTTYRIQFHRKLGGYPTEVVPNKGGASTNLDNDVYGHIMNDHLMGFVEHGIYGYVCREKRGGGGWSTHAFGIAVDVSSADEYFGKCSSDVNYRHAPIWEKHNWYWGLAFCDPMHFQYATGY